MAIGTKANFKIYNEFTQTAYVETATQMSDAFNAASAGAIRLQAESRIGDFNYESFFQNTANLISRRITEGSGSTSPVTDKSLDQGEATGVKVNRKIGPVAQTLDAFRKVGRQADENSLNFAVGAQAAKAAQIEQLNTAIRSVRAALIGQTASTHTVASNGSLSTMGLIDGLAKYGDAAGSIRAWVMHSKVAFDIIKDQVTQKLPNYDGILIAGASPASLGRPVIITDADALYSVAGSPAVTTYYTMGLTDAAVTVTDSETETIFTEIVTGLENLVVRYQGEFAYNVEVKGFTYDVTNGGKNPSDTAIGTSANWDPILSSHKDRAGVVISSR